MTSVGFFCAHYPRGDCKWGSWYVLYVLTTRSVRVRSHFGGVCWRVDRCKYLHVNQKQIRRDAETPWYRFFTVPREPPQTSANKRSADALALKAETERVDAQLATVRSEYDWSKFGWPGTFALYSALKMLCSHGSWVLYCASQKLCPYLNACIDPKCQLSHDTERLGFLCANHPNCPVGISTGRYHSRKACPRLHDMRLQVSAEPTGATATAASYAASVRSAPVRTEKNDAGGTGGTGDTGAVGAVYAMSRLRIGFSPVNPPAAQAKQPIQPQLQLQTQPDRPSDYYAEPEQDDGQYPYEEAGTAPSEAWPTPQEPLQRSGSWQDPVQMSGPWQPAAQSYPYSAYSAYGAASTSAGAGSVAYVLPPPPTPSSVYYRPVPNSQPFEPRAAFEGGFGGAYQPDYNKFGYARAGAHLDADYADWGADVKSATQLPSEQAPAYVSTPAATAAATAASFDASAASASDVTDVTAASAACGGEDDMGRSKALRTCDADCLECRGNRPPLKRSSPISSSVAAAGNWVDSAAQPTSAFSQQTYSFPGFSPTAGASASVFRPIPRLPVGSPMKPL